LYNGVKITRTPWRNDVVVLGQHVRKFVHFVTLRYIVCPEVKRSWWNFNGVVSRHP